MDFCVDLDTDNQCYLLGGCNLLSEAIRKRGGMEREKNAEKKSLVSRVDCDVFGDQIDYV